MTIKETNHQFIFESQDGRGTFQIAVSKDLRQIQFNTEVGEWDNSDYADTNLNEITMLRDMLTRAIDKEVDNG